MNKGVPSEANHALLDDQSLEGIVIILALLMYFHEW